MVPAPDILPVRDIVRGGLVLRRYTEADAEALATAVDESTEHLRPWMPWADGTRRPSWERAAFIAAVIQQWDAGGDMNFGIFLGPLVVGGCGLHRRRGPRGLEIGYWVHGAHINKGYATLAAGALTSAAFTLESVDFVEIHHDEANVRSRRVPEKLGYRLVGTAPDEKTSQADSGVDCTWRIMRGEWRGAPAWCD
jgi:ribosomal-protein-serine acetyltransferase